MNVATARIISMSLYGNERLYIGGALENVNHWQTYYPMWEFRIYYDANESALKESLPELEDRGVSLIPMENKGGIHGMFWRFLAAADPNASHVIVRDVDSRLNVRERAAVYAWIESGRDGHVMRDNPEHGIPMMGGMWGIKGGVVPDMAACIERWGQWQNKRDDQDFLLWNVWPRIRNNCLQHGLNGVPFPPHAPYAGFVGEPIAPRDTTV